MSESASQEFYNLEDLNLNRDLVTGVLTSNWGNLGYWCDKQTQGYTQAAKQLAITLGEFAELSPEDHIFDAGFGCGDQLQVWENKFQVSSIAGVNLSASQTQMALDNYQGLDRVPVQIRQGDACWKSAWQNLPENINKILALDCLYHFDQKRDFFQHCATQLKSHHHKNASITVTDFILTRSSLSIFKKWFLQLICKLSHIPFDNLKTLDDYQSQLEEVGLTLVRHQDISHSVMDGFAQWLPKFKREYESARKDCVALPRVAWAKYMGTAWFLTWIRKHQIFEYHLLTIEPIE